MRVLVVHVSDSDFISTYSFPGTPKQLTMTTKSKYTSIEDFKTNYTSEERVVSLQRYIHLSATGDMGEVILVACSKEDEVNMISPSDTLNPFFYLHLPIIQDLGFFIPFTEFEVEVLVIANVTPPRSHLMVEAS